MRGKFFPYRFMKIALAATVPFISGSCQWITAESDNRELEELDRSLAVTQRNTRFETALKNFGEMLRAYHIPQTPVQSKNIGNDTAEEDVPRSLYGMIASTATRIGPPVVFVPYDAQYVVAESTTGGTISRLYPKIVITGGIDGFDKDMIQKQRKGTAQGGWAGGTGGARYSAEGGISRVTLDLTLMDYRTQSYFPGVLASNALLLRKSNMGWGVYGYYMGNGASFDSDYREKQGVYAGLRALVELSMIELMGRYFEVPYWKCVKGVTRDNEMIDMMKLKFLDMPQEKQLLNTKKILFLDGVDDLDYATPGATAYEERIILNAMREKKVSTLWELYLNVWERLSLASAQTRAQLAKKKEELLILQEKAEKLKLEKEARRKEELLRRQRIVRIRSYREQMDRADGLYAKGDTSAALIIYRTAHQLLPEEPLAAEMIARIAREESRLKEQKRYRVELIAKADAWLAELRSQDFNRSDFEKVLALYREAEKLDENDMHVKRQIDGIMADMNKYSSLINPGQEVKW